MPAVSIAELSQSVLHDLIDNSRHWNSSGRNVKCVQRYVGGGALELSAHVARWSREQTLLVNEYRRPLSPRTLQRAMWVARAAVPGLPAGFRYQDLRHYFASLLIASGADVKVVQARLRHASAKTTLDTYAHLWPDSDDSTRAAIDAVLLARSDVAAVSHHGNAQDGPPN